MRTTRGQPAARAMPCQAMALLVGLVMLSQAAAQRPGRAAALNGTRPTDPTVLYATASMERPAMLNLTSGMADAAGVRVQVRAQAARPSNQLPYGRNGCGNNGPTQPHIWTCALCRVAFGVQGGGAREQRPMLPAELLTE